MFSRLAKAKKAALSTFAFAALFALVPGCGLAVDNNDRLERANEALEAGDFRAAVIDTKSVLQQEPENTDARLILARSSLGLGDGETAESNFRKALALGVPLEEIAIDFGRALLMNGEFNAILEELPREIAGNQAKKHAIMQLRGDARMGLGLTVVARSVYEDILKEDADNISARLGVAISFAAEGNHEAAREAVNGALDREPDNIKLWLTSASIAANGQDSKTALEHYDRALELAKVSGDPRNEVAALSGVVESQLALGNIQAADESLRSLVALAPDEVSVKYLLARSAFMKQDYDASNDRLLEVLRAAPSFLPGQLLMGAVQFQLGRLGQAESYLSSVISAAPQNQEARGIMAEIRLQQGRPDEAAAILGPVIESGGATDAIKALALRASLLSGQSGATVDALRKQLDESPEDANAKLQLAAALIATGETAEADSILASIDDADDDVAVRRELLRIYGIVGRGEPEAALLQAESLVEKIPEDPRAHNLLGALLRSLGRLEDARQSFLNEQTIVPGSLSTYVNIANIDLQLGDLDAARKQLVSAHELQPESIDILVGLARLEGRAGDSDAARRWLERAIEVDPTASAPRNLLARLFLSIGDLENAETAAQEAVSTDPNEAGAHELLGLVFERQGNLAEAIDSMKKAAELAPDRLQFRNNLARLYASAGDFDLAESTLTNSGEVDLENLEQASTVAALRANQGDLDGALEIVRALKEKHPGEAAPFVVEAELYAANNQFKEASLAYDQALALSDADRMLALRAHGVRRVGGLASPEAPLLGYLESRPDDLEIRSQVAQSYGSRGLRRESIEHYELALEMAPDNFVIMNNLAWEYLQENDDRAESMARRAYELAPTNSNVVDTLGWILVQNNQNEEGVRLLQNAIELGNESPAVKYHLGAGLAKLNKTASAIQLLDEALATDSEFSGRRDAEALRSRLEQ